MPFLKEIVDDINTNWQSFLPDGKFFGIIETLVDEQVVNDAVALVRYPAMVDDTGDGLPIIPDSLDPFVVYHKLESITNSYEDKTGRRFEKEVANMVLVCFGYINILQHPAYWLENVLKDLMTLNNRRPMQSSVITVGASTFDKLGMLGREYAGVMPSFPNLIGFEMRYRIESTYTKGCFITNLQK